jgi:hypothetical protein
MVVPEGATTCAPQRARVDNALVKAIAVRIAGDD